MHPYLHKIPPDDHHTRLHLHTNIHTKILTHTHLHKILAGAHHTPLHPHTIIHKMLTTCWHFTSTRNVTNNNSHNIKIYPGQIKIYIKKSGLYTVPSFSLCKGSHPNVKAPGCTNTFSKHKSLIFPEICRLANKCAIRTGTLFNLLPTDILHIIVIWLVGLEYRKNLNAAVSKVNILCSTILRIDANQS